MFTRLHWLSIVVPVLLVAIIELLSDTVLDADLPFPVDTILIALVVLAMAAILSGLAFRQIDRLTGELRLRNEELQARNATARGLQEVAVNVAAGGPIEQTLDMVVARARSLLAADIVAIEVAMPDSLHLQRVWPTDAAAGLATTTPEQSLDDRLEAVGFAARLVTPIRLGSGTAGVLGVARGAAGGFDVEDVETLSALAGLAGVAVRNHQLRGSLRELAVRTERERIAREMHDGLAQVLAYVSAKSAAVDQLLELGEITDARTHLAALGAAARSTYVDVRETILGLTTPVAAEQGLVAALDQYGARFADSAKIAVVVDASAEARLASLPAEAEVQAFRIVQEALTNVRKHAEASRVEINVATSCQEVVVEVRDDGRGFDPQVHTATDWPHYGRATMAARAAEVGGAVDWLSSPDGTTVRLRVPMARVAASGSTPAQSVTPVTLPADDLSEQRPVPVAGARP